MIVARDRCAVGLIDPPEVLCVAIQSTQFVGDAATAAAAAAAAGGKKKQKAKGKKQKAKGKKQESMVAGAAPASMRLPTTTQEIIKVPVTNQGGPPAKAERHRLRAC